MHIVTDTRDRAAQEIAWASRIIVETRFLADLKQFCIRVLELVKHVVVTAVHNDFLRHRASKLRIWEEIVIGLDKLLHVVL